LRIFLHREAAEKEKGGEPPLNRSRLFLGGSFFFDKVVHDLNRTFPSTDHVRGSEVAVIKERKEFPDLNSIADFFAQNGLNKEEFLKNANSFSTAYRGRRMPRLQEAAEKEKGGEPPLNRSRLFLGLSAT